MQEIWNGAYMHDVWQTDIRYLMYIFLTHASTFHIPGSLHAMAAPLVRGENRTCGHAHWIMLGGWGNGGNVDGPSMFNARACWHSLNLHTCTIVVHISTCWHRSCYRQCFNTWVSLFLLTGGLQISFKTQITSSQDRWKFHILEKNKECNVTALREYWFISTTCKEKHTLFLM